jgi:phage baseplate assembly protein W
MVQLIRNQINYAKSIIGGIEKFVQGQKDFIYSVTDLIRSSAQNVQLLLKAIDIDAFLDDAKNALRGTLYEVRRTDGQILLTARQWERVGIIPPTLTLPQTASVLRPVQIPLGPGDTLASVAARVLGDSALWPSLVSINNLDYPYLDFSDTFGGPDPAYAAAGLKVLGAGNQLKIPLPVSPGVVALAQDPFGTDLQDTQLLHGGSPKPVSLIGGFPNLSAAIVRRLLTPIGKIPWHPDYGSTLKSMLGSPSSLANVESIENEVSRCILSDPRILSIQNMTASLDGNTVSIEALLLTSKGQMNLTFPIAA